MCICVHHKNGKVFIIVCKDGNKVELELGEARKLAAHIISMLIEEKLQKDRINPN